jgi:ribonuclease Y
MEIVIAAALVAAGLLGAALLHRSTAASAGQDEIARRADLERHEHDLERREHELQRRELDAERRERALADQLAEADDLQAERRLALERASGLSPGEARQELLRETEEEARHDAARMLRQVEEETKRDAARRVRNILAVATQRLAAQHASQTTVSVVTLPADDMKGRIIGREGRNIRALENLTGVDFIIDDTPSAVVLSAFDGVRREVARLTLERLLQDGRIHPARIEETYYQAKSELEAHMLTVGRTRSWRPTHGLDPELIRLLGRLRPSASYGPERPRPLRWCARIWPRPMAQRARRCRRRSPRRAPARHRQGRLARGRRARTRSSGGNSPAATASPRPSRTPWRPTTTRSSRRRRRPSSSRPPTRSPAPATGARGSRSSTTSSACASSSSSPSAIPASTRSTRCRPGREIRVIVAPGAVDDDGAALLARAGARDIERELEYPGQIKVTVIRSPARSTTPSDRWLPSPRP